MIKNKEKRLKKSIKSVIIRTLLYGMVPLTFLTSCQTTVYTLNHGTRAVLEDVTPAEKAEWRKNVNVSLPNYIDGHTNTDALKMVDTNVEMPITMRNNTVDMAMNKEFYSKYTEDCNWCYDYIKDLFAIIAPDAKINLKVINNAIDEKTFFSPHIIAYGEQNYEESNILGATNKHLNVTTKEVDKVAISSNIIMNSKYEENFTEQSSYFRKALLHETMHAFGLNHLEDDNGGNVMDSRCSDSVLPLTLSPDEMEKMVSLYSTRSESFLSVFLNWYRRQYDNCLSYSAKHAEEYKAADPATRSQIVLNNTVDLEDFFKIYKQYAPASLDM